MIPGPNWARRYGTQHRRLCARPGCGTPAAATLRFQPTQREAWLVDIDAATPRAEGDLCARHAGALVLPRGWELHDERTVRPAVAEVTALRRPRTRSTPVARAPRRRITRPDLVELPGLVEQPSAPEPAPMIEPVVAPAVEPGVEVVAVAEVVEIAEIAEMVEVAEVVELAETPAVELLPNVPPQLGATEAPPEEELAEVLDARTPLLQRAFRNARPK
jgi:hypothetical protein